MLRARWRTAHAVVVPVFACAVFGALAWIAAGEAEGAVSGASAGTTLLAPTWTLDAGAHLAALAAQESPTPIAPQATAAPVDRGPSPAMAGLKSLILPGWGQLSTGHKTQAAIFFTLEAATWASFITFQRQSTLRRESSFETARLYANIDLETKEEDFRRLVGLYQSNEVFNQYVIMREAAFFIDDPEEQQRYIEENSIGPEDAWFWESREAFDRYRQQRESADQAEHNGRFALGTAIVTRLVSGVMAARQAADNRRRLDEQAAVPGQPVGRLVFDVRPGPGLATESRLAWVVTF